ncbi:MAG: HAMP domain-containing histidine kinase [Caldisericaceae bacterium]
MTVFLFSLAVLLLLSFFFLQNNALTELEDFVKSMPKEENKDINNATILSYELTENLKTLQKEYADLTKDCNDKIHLYSLILNSIEEPILVIRKNGEISYKNKKALEILKIKEKGLFYEAIRNTDLLNIISEALQSWATKTNTIEINNSTYYVKSYHIDFENNNSVIFILRKETTLEKDALVKTEFLEAVSHEMKTPLSSIIATLEIIENESFIKKGGEKFLKILKDNTLRLSNLIERILKLSEIDSFGGSFNEIVDLKKIAESIKSRFELICKKRGLSLLVKADSIHLKGNSYFIEDILNNLVENAIKYTEVGRIEIEIKKEDDVAIVEVKDTGRGIKEGNLNKVFEPFYREDKSRNEALKGTGLGLTITKKLVTQMNGEIEVESKVGIGTTFRVKFHLSN